MITDFSEEGARIFVHDAVLPDKFYLLISGDRTAQETCQVAWRLGDEVGVRFITERPSRERLQLVERLRTQAKQLLGAG
jgi:hypothetical protein